MSLHTSDGEPSTELPESRMEMSFEPMHGGRRFIGVTGFASGEAMAQVISMGVVEGQRSALGRLDGVLG